jgi:hypothetical protein
MVSCLGSLKSSAEVAPSLLILNSYADSTFKAFVTEVTSEVLALRFY